ncbi:MAG: hypothetical protein K0U98_02870 [Deltaproteobacteria bacterium]|nr:hypothetical protein [Deltaproteobacteria bacterium]
MYKTSLLSWGIVALLLLIWPVASGGTTVLKQDVGELVDRAPLIFIGTAIDKQLGILEKVGYPTTLVTFQVDELFKGMVEGTEVTLAFEGGELGGEIFEVIGMPKFEVGGKYLLFVRTNGSRGGCPILGWGQGKLDFLSHPFTGTEMLVDYRGAPVLGLENDDWRLAPVSVGPSGLAKTAAAIGVELIAEDGVEISGLADLEALAGRAWASVPGAQGVIDSLRSFFQSRTGSETYLPGSFVASVQMEGLLSSEALISPMRPASAPSISPQPVLEPRGAAEGEASRPTYSVSASKKEILP